MTIDDAERRRRLVRRHHLGRTAADVPAAVRGVVGLHSSDPLTPYLGAWARVAGFHTEDLGRLLYEHRTLVRMHAVRGTLFVVASADLPLLEAAGARSLARSERRRLERWLAAEMEPDAVRSWLEEVTRRVVTLAGDGVERSVAELIAGVPELATPVTVGSGRWTTAVPLASRLVVLLALEGRLVRARPAGSWRSSQYRWSSPGSWFGRDLPSLDPASARVELARRYLLAYGPATITDLRWWTGWTAAQTSAALSGLETLSVDLEAGGVGLVMARDEAPGEDLPGRRVALLPGLDPTPMGWKERDWYVGPHQGQIFDRNGNVGPTVWVDGRIVGGWGQRPGGEVVYELFEEVEAPAVSLVAEESSSLTEWLDGVVAVPRFHTPVELRLSRGPD